MNWNDISEKISVLYVGKSHVATIRRKSVGNYPYYFHVKPFFVSYNGGFKTMKTAKNHLHKKATAFARSVLNEG